ncbi:MAG TPA: TetR/AcrR family transcriptional regulator [Dermatophilaceae bacterium]
MERKLDRGARRAEIIAAAITAFSERGIANTTVSDIVQAAGVAQGTFYLYFESKDDVVLAAAESIGDTLIEGVEQAVALPDRSAVDKLVALGEQLSDLTSVPGVSDLAEIMHHPGNRVLHDRLTEQLTPRLALVLERIVEQGVSEGMFAVPETHAAAWFVLGGLRSVELSRVPLAEMPVALAAATALALRALGYKNRDAHERR